MFRISVLASLVLAQATLAQPTAFFAPRAINLSPGEAEALGVTCAQQYSRVAQAPVLSPSEAQAAVGPNGSLVDAAQALNVAEWVELTVVNLDSARGGGQLLISAVRRTAAGVEVHRADITAASMGDAVPACERLALALTRRVSVEATRTRSNVTLSEAQASKKPNRIGTEKVLGVRAGFMAPVGGSTPFGTLGSLVFDARLERDRYFIEVGAGFLIPAVVSGGAPGYGALTTELGASFYLGDGDIAPYLGAGIQPRVSFSGGGFNLAPYAQGGLMFFRESSTRIYADARIAPNLFPVTAFSSGSNARPVELSVQFGVGW